MSMLQFTLVTALCVGSIITIVLLVFLLSFMSLLDLIEGIKEHGD